jgi:hypothetical protein
MKKKQKPRAKQPKAQESQLLEPDMQESMEPAIQMTPSSGRSVEADAKVLSNPALSATQRQQLAARIGRLGGNQHLQRVVAQANSTKPEATGAAVQRESGWDLFNDEEEEQVEQPEQEYEIHEESLEAKMKIAARVVRRIRNAIEPGYEAMLEDPKKFKSLNVSGQIAKALKWAFDITDTYAGEYLGWKHHPLVLRKIHEVPGLYEKLSVLVGMEPFQARALRNYLDIQPPTKFDYEMTMQGVGGGEGGEAIVMGVDIVCKEDDKKLWHTLYVLGGTGVGLSAVPVTASIGSTSFETPSYWSPQNFVGSMTFTTASAGFVGGIGLGTGKIYGDATKTPIKLDLSGWTWMSPNLAVGTYGGFLEVATSAQLAQPSAAPPTAPTINIIKQVDESEMVMFGANSSVFPGFNSTELQSKIEPTMKRDDYEITITGSSSYNTEENRRLLDARLEAVRKEFEVRGLFSGALGAAGLPKDKVKIERTVRDAVPEGEDQDPAMDRAIVVRLTGSMTEAME